jgi:hypothetical protein
MVLQTAKNKITKAMRLDTFAAKENLPRKINADRVYTQCCKEVSFSESESLTNWYNKLKNDKDKRVLE